MPSQDDVYSKHDFSMMDLGWLIIKTYAFPITVYFLLSATYFLETLNIKYLGKLSEAVSGSAQGLQRVISTIIFILFLSYLFRAIMYILDGWFMPFLETAVRMNVLERDIRSNEDLGVSNKDMVMLPQYLRWVFEQIRHVLLPSIVGLVSVVFFVWRVDARLGVMLLCVTILTFLLCVANVSAINDYFTDKEIVREDSMSEVFEDILNSRETVLEVGTFKQELQIFYDTNVTFTKAYSGRYMFSSTLKLLIILVMYIQVIYGVVRVCKLFRTKQRSIRLEDVTSVVLLLVQFLNQVSRLLVGIGEFAFMIRYVVAKAALNRLNVGTKGVIVPYKSTVQNLHSLQRFGTNGNKRMSVISASNVILRRSDFRLRINSLRFNGGFLAVVGQSGSGKSTILRFLMKKSKDFSGTLRVFGSDLASIDDRVMLDAIAFVPQKPKVFRRSLLDNVLYGTNKTKAHVEQLMDAFGIDVLHKEDLDRIMHDESVTFSGGQIQVMCILRALLREASLILMDEPTSALDEKSRDAVIRLISEVKQHVPVVAITHCDEMRKAADTVLRLEKGEARQL